MVGWDGKGSKLEYLLECALCKSPKGVQRAVSRKANDVGVYAVDRKPQVYSSIHLPTEDNNLIARNVNFTTSYNPGGIC